MSQPVSAFAKECTALLDAIRAAPTYAEKMQLKDELAAKIRANYLRPDATLKGTGTRADSG